MARPNRSDYAAAVRDGGTWRFALGAAMVAIVILGVARTFVNVGGSMFLFWAAMAVVGTLQGSAETRARHRRLSS